MTDPFTAIALAGIVAFFLAYWPPPDDPSPA